MRLRKEHIPNSFNLLKLAAKEFGNDHAMKLSASLSYYTIFSLVPMLVIIVSLCSIFFGKEAVQGELYWQIKEWTGSEVAAQIQSMIKNAQRSNQSVLATTIGIITLIIGATGIFTEIQGSINYIWSIKAKPKRGWLKFLTVRLLSFALTISLGFLMLVSLVLNTVMDLLFNKLEKILPQAIYMVYIVNIVLVIAVIILLFAVIFKVLPDGKLTWRDAFVGAAFTAFLFMLGKFIIGFYISKMSIVSTYGSSSAVVLILVWVYFSSVILYFGAEFTKVYAAAYGHEIHPDVFAVRIEKKEVEHTEQILKKKPLLTTASTK